MLDLHISSVGEVGNRTKVLVCSVDSEGDADVDCGNEHDFDPQLHMITGLDEVFGGDQPNQYAQGQTL